MIREFYRLSKISWLKSDLLHVVIGFFNIGLNLQVSVSPALTVTKQSYLWSCVQRIHNCGQGVASKLISDENLT
jgi:hypothetical protein